MTQSAVELFGLTKRVSLVTGAGNGMARATALNLADVGADVVVVDIDGDAAEQTAAEVRARGVRSCVVVCDLTDHQAPRDMVDAAVTEFGRLDVAVNFCGGTGGVYKPLLDMTVDEWNVPMELNLVSTFLSTQAEAIAMITTGGLGSIVNVSSTSGMMAAPQIAGYGAANAGIIHFTKTAAVELGEYGVRVNCVVPGSHWTKGSRARVADPVEGARFQAFFDETARAAPLGRMGEAQDTAGVALFLASNLSSYLTGHAVPSDGGVLHSTGRMAAGGKQVPEAIKVISR